MKLSYRVKAYFILCILLWICSETVFISLYYHWYNLNFCTHYIFMSYLEYANLERKCQLQKGTTESYFGSKPGAYTGSDGVLARFSYIRINKVRLSLRVPNILPVTFVSSSRDLYIYKRFQWFFSECLEFKFYVYAERRRISGLQYTLSGSMPR